MNVSSYRELQKRAKALGLRAIGKTEELRNNIVAEEARRANTRSADVFLLGLPKELVMTEVRQYLHIRDSLCLALLNKDFKRCFDSVEFWMPLCKSTPYLLLQHAMMDWAMTGVLLTTFVSLVEKLVDRLDIKTLHRIQLYLLERDKRIAAEFVAAIAKKHYPSASYYFRTTIKDVEELRKTIAGYRERRRKRNYEIVNNGLSSLRISLSSTQVGLIYVVNALFMSMSMADIKMTLEKINSVDLLVSPYAQTFIMLAILADAYKELTFDPILPHFSVGEIGKNLMAVWCNREQRLRFYPKGSSFSLPYAPVNDDHLFKIYINTASRNVINHYIQQPISPLEMEKNVLNYLERRFEYIFITLSPEVVAGAMGDLSPQQCDYVRKAIVNSSITAQMNVWRSEFEKLVAEKK